MSEPQDAIDLTKGLMQKELKPCAVCGKGLAHNKSLNFYRITIESHVVNLHAVERQLGLEMMLGSAMLAFHMGPQENMSVLMSKTEPLCVCFDCAMRVCLPGLSLEHIKEEDEATANAGVYLEAREIANDE